MTYEIDFFTANFNFFSHHCFAGAGLSQSPSAVDQPLNSWNIQYDLQLRMKADIQRQKREKEEALTLTESDSQDGLYTKSCMSLDGTLSHHNYDFNLGSLEKRIVNKVTTTVCYIEELNSEVEAIVETVVYEEHEVTLPQGNKMADFICTETQYMSSRYNCKDGTVRASREYSTGLN